jgi:hypothetical protein
MSETEKVSPGRTVTVINWLATLIVPFLMAICLMLISRITEIQDMQGEMKASISRQEFEIEILKEKLHQHEQDRSARRRHASEDLW